MPQFLNCNILTVLPHVSSHIFKSHVIVRFIIKLCNFLMAEQGKYKRVYKRAVPHTDGLSLQNNMSSAFMKFVGLNMLAYCEVVNSYGGYKENKV